MFPGGNKMFLSPKEALVWSEAQPCARNGFGHFLSAFALSPAPSMSSVVTTQSPVPGGDELQGLPVLAQLGVTDLCPTSNSRAGLFLFPCPQDEDISPRPLHSGTSRRTCLQGCRCENTLPGIWDIRGFSVLADGSQSSPRSSAPRAVLSLVPLEHAALCELPHPSNAMTPPALFLLLVVLYRTP